MKEDLDGDEIKPLEIDIRQTNDLSENNRFSIIEFAVSSYAVLENEGKCRIIVERYGRLDNQIQFR